MHADLVLDDDYIHLVVLEFDGLVISSYNVCHKIILEIIIEENQTGCRIRGE